MMKNDRFFGGNVKVINGNMFQYATVLVIFCAVNVWSEQIAPPEYQIIDPKFSINAGGGIAKTIPTVDIGGTLGLQHSFSVYSEKLIGEVPYPSGYLFGFTDKFGGNARYTRVLPPNTSFADRNDFQGSWWSAGLWMMEVHDHEGSATFKIVSNGVAQGWTNYSLTSNYSYEALRDRRHILEVPVSSPEYLLWTKPDGTEVWFRRGAGANAASKGYLEKIIYPHGLELKFNRIPGTNRLQSVTTSTGFQLKYNYVLKGPANTGAYGMDPSYRNRVPMDGTLEWSSKNPASIIGINMAIERCSDGDSIVCVSASDPCPAFEYNQTCNKMANDWPAARVDWPLGMPRRIYLYNSEVKITNASGHVTTFYTARKTISEASYTYPSPRLVAIKDTNADLPYVNFGYSIPAYYQSSKDPEGYLSSASGIYGSVTGPGAGSQVTENPQHLRFGTKDIKVEKRSDYLGALHRVETLDGSIVFEQSLRNRVVASYPNDGPTEHYEYDGRNNITAKILNQGLVDESRIEAQYPPSCTSSNRKICNKALWIKDARGNTTHYTYHALSGQVETITYPANAQGFVAQTRYTYEPYYASYLNENGVKATAQRPIYLKKYERFCADSNYASGSCAGSDEVQIEFQYASDNLFLTSKIVTAKNASGVQQSKRTCYQYDIYGNLIGEISPGANLAACPN